MQSTSWILSSHHNNNNNNNKKLVECLFHIISDSIIKPTTTWWHTKHAICESIMFMNTCLFCYYIFNRISPILPIRCNHVTHYLSNKIKRRVFIIYHTLFYRIYTFVYLVFMATFFCSNNMVIYRSHRTKNESVEGLRPSVRGPDLVTFGACKLLFTMKLLNWIYISSCSY